MKHNQQFTAQLYYYNDNAQMSGWIKKISYTSLQEISFKQIESKRIEKDYHSQRSHKTSGAAILMVDKVDFKAKIITRDE